MTVQLLALNDFHGHLEPPSGQVAGVDAGGAAHLAATLAELREETPNTLLVSAGDLVGASPLPSGLLHDEPTVELMNGWASISTRSATTSSMTGSRSCGGCRTAAATLTGAVRSTLSRGRSSSSWRRTCSTTATGEPLFPASEVVDVGGGARIAFIGMTLDGTPEIVRPEAVEGYTFVNEVETVERLVPDLVADGVEAIVVLVHEGGWQAGTYDGCEGLSGPIFGIVADLPPEVDVVITGHTHQAYVCIVGQRLVTSAGSFGQLVTDIDLTIDPVSGHFLTGEARNVIVTRDAADGDTEAFVESIVEFVAPLAEEEVGTAAAALTRTEGPGGQSTLGMVVADARREAAGADVGFMNSGGLRDDIAAGSVTYADTYAVSPFGNTILVKAFTGTELHDLLEEQFEVGHLLLVSGTLSYAYSVSAPEGDKVEPASILLDGIEVAPEDTITVAVDDFIGTGALGFTGFTDAAHVGAAGVDVDALADHFRNNSPIDPPPFDRVTALP